MVDIQGFIQSSMRIFNVSRKPGWKDYKMIASITGLGIIVIGTVGLVVKLIIEGIIKL
ncbi:MAG: protein translocase SEC61 complex subunit gamma [archaeon]|nr:protein translocase SEC61 complex subunit gamma [archaeon]